MDIGQLNNDLRRIKLQNNTTEKSTGYKFEEKLANIINKSDSGDEYIHVSANTKGYCELYNELKTSSSFTSQLPIETQNYKIEAADKSYTKDIVITDKRSNKTLYLNQNEIILQKDAQTNLKFLFDTSDQATIQPNFVVDEELEETLRTCLNKSGNTLPETQLQGYTVNTNSQTGIKYLTRNGQEGKGADILLLTESDRKKFEEIAQAYLKYPNIAENKSVAEIRAAMEITGNSKRCENGVLTLIDGYMSFTSYDGKKENSWSIVLDSKVKYDAAYKQLGSGRLQGIEDQDFWDKFFENLEKNGNDNKQSEDSTKSNIIVKADGSKVLQITMKICGMESTMNIKISDPEDMDESLSNSAAGHEQDSTVTNTAQNMSGE